MKTAFIVLTKQKKNILFFFFFFFSLFSFIWNQKLQMKNISAKLLFLISSISCPFLKIYFRFDLISWKFYWICGNFPLIFLPLVHDYYEMRFHVLIYYYSGFWSPFISSVGQILYWVLIFFFYWLICLYNHQVGFEFILH